MGMHITEFRSLGLSYRLRTGMKDVRDRLSRTDDTTLHI